MGRDIAKQTKRGSDVRCEPCKNGRHYPDCLERACACHCIQRSAVGRLVTLRLVQTWPEDYRDPTYLLEMMDRERVVVRTGRDGTIWFKPAPKKLSEHLQAMLSEYRREIVRLFVPIPYTWNSCRPWWGWSTIGACVSCGHSTPHRNPLGEVMHPTCGFIDQRQWTPQVVSP